LNLDELKKKLLAALPPAIREKLGVKLDEDLDDEDLDEVDGEEATDSHDLDEIAKSDSDSEDEDEDDAEEDEDDEEAAKKAKKSKIIRIVVMCAVAFFLLDEFMGESEQGGDAGLPVVAAPKMSPDKRAMLEKKKQEEAQKAAMADGTAQEEVQAPSDVEDEQTPIAIETPVIVQQDEPEQPSYDSSSDSQENETSYQDLQENNEEVPPETPAVVLTPAQEMPVVIVPTPNIDLGMDEEQDKKESSLDMLMKAVDKSEKISEKNMKNTMGRDDSSYIEPPNYLRSGRGLVYNCKENHWACVDKFSYFTCYENQNWNKENGQSTECITRDVYASAADCTAIQKFYVNKPEPTDFCGKSTTPSTSESEQPNNQEQDDLSNLVAP